MRRGIERYKTRYILNKSLKMQRQTFVYFDSQGAKPKVCFDLKDEKKKDL